MDSPRENKVFKVLVNKQNALSFFWFSFLSRTQWPQEKRCRSLRKLHAPNREGGEMEEGQGSHLQRQSLPGGKDGRLLFAAPEAEPGPSGGSRDACFLPMAGEIFQRLPLPIKGGPPGRGRASQPWRSPRRWRGSCPGGAHRRL